MKGVRTVTGISLMALIVCAIGYIFWQQEMKYWLPTPVPSTLRQVAMGDHVSIDLVRMEQDKPLFIHFYNFDCPCSRFNVNEFQSMYYRYRDQVEFIALVQSSDPSQELVSKFQRMLGVPIHTRVDTNGEVAQSLGVYATPQAVIMDNQSRVFYKGNYNAARYCTSKSTKFAEMAMRDILAGKTEPRFADQFVELPYGCLIPAYGHPQLTLSTP